MRWLGWGEQCHVVARHHSILSTSGKSCGYEVGLCTSPSAEEEFLTAVCNIGHLSGLKKFCRSDPCLAWRCWVADKGQAQFPGPATSSYNQLHQFLQFYVILPSVVWSGIYVFIIRLLLTTWATNVPMLYGILPTVVWSSIYVFIIR
jgi:hypothetical protein